MEIEDHALLNRLYLVLPGPFGADQSLFGKLIATLEPFAEHSTRLHVALGLVPARLV